MRMCPVFPKGPPAVFSQHIPSSKEHIGFYRVPILGVSRVFLLKPLLWFWSMLLLGGLPTMADELHLPGLLFGVVPLLGQLPARANESGLPSG